MFNSLCNKKGITIIEVVLTLFLTTVGIMALLSMQPISWQTAGRSDFMGRAAGILQSELERNEIRIMNPGNTVSTGTTSATVYPSGKTTKQQGDVAYTVATTTLIAWLQCLAGGCEGDLAGKQPGHRRVADGDPTGDVPAMIRRQKGSRGFTLVECVVAVAVGMAVLGAVYAAVWSGQRSATGIDRKVTTGQDARAALEVMAMEMRMASYNPFYAANPWTDMTNCNAGDATRRGIQNAAAGTIQIQMDLNGSGSCGEAGAANEIIVYALDTANQRITRETWTCSGAPASGGVQSFLGAAAGQVKTVRVVNHDVAIPFFRYFDSAGTDITSSLPGAIGQIRRIEITLVVDSENVDPSLAGSQRRRMIYSTSVVPRNHGIQF